MSEKDVKPKVYYIVDSSQLNNQPTRVYNTEPKWLIGAVEWTKVIELEPTLQLMKEMGEALKNIPDDEIIDNRYYFISGNANEALEKYRKFLEGLKWKIG